MRTLIPTDDQVQQLLRLVHRVSHFQPSQPEESATSELDLTIHESRNLIDEIEEVTAQRGKQT